MSELAGQPENARGPIAVVASRFNAFIVDRLVEGALATLERCGIEGDAVHLSRVPGAFELPLAAKVLASQERYRAIVALGAVIRGETPHFDFVAGECARGLTDVSLQYGVPVGMGVITCDDVDQARARAGGSVGNKGEEATLAALEMVAWLSRVSSDGQD